MPRGVLGYALFCAGGAVLAFAGGRYALGAWAQQDARRAWEQFEAQSVVALARRNVEHVAFDASSIVEGTPIARLVIPRLGLDEIVMEGVDGDALNAGPGHLPGSAFPGERGNSVISAHRDRHFSRLGAIQVGDTIVTEAGARADRWVVIAKRVVEADAPALFRTPHATLTLTTCWPIRYFGTAPERLLVVARPVRSGPPEIPSFAAASSS
jgi:sortase A